MIDDKLFIERLKTVMESCGCRNQPTKFAEMIGCSEKTIRSALNGKIPGPKILGKMATADYPAAWIIGGQSTITANNCRDVITQSVIEQGDHSGHMTMDVSERERQLLLGMREYFSAAEIRAIEHRIDERKKELGL